MDGRIRRRRCPCTFENHSGGTWNVLRPRHEARRICSCVLRQPGCRERDYKRVPIPPRFVLCIFQIATSVLLILVPGIQICATLDDLGPLNSLARSHISGLTLTIVYSKQHGFQLSITPPTQALLSLGNGITTTPLKPSVQTSPPRLTVSTDVSIPLPHSAQPLVFDLVLGVDLTGASGTSAVERWWTNPLGIGENVKIGPKLMLSLDIIFAQFVTTGSIRSDFTLENNI